MKIDELKKLSDAADIKYYMSAAELSMDESSFRRAYCRHACENYMLTIAEIERLNKEIEQHARTDPGLMFQLTELDV